jgi:SAM-dependent methyltransferase
MDKTSYIETDKPLYIANLVARMEQNEALGTRDFEAWVFSHQDYRPGCDVLDVACGTGKSLFKLLSLHPDIGRVTAVDFAEPAIRELGERARGRGIAAIDARVLDMEGLTSTLAGRRFDHIYSIYGIHYSPRFVELLCEYRALLKPGGTIFFCGPDAFCNTPVMRILSGCGALDADPIPTRMLRPFVSERQLTALRASFAAVDVVHFENRIPFPDVEAFMTWWRNHDLYREWAEPVMRERVAGEIRAAGAFVVNKNVRGVLLRT